MLVQRLIFQSSVTGWLQVWHSCDGRRFYLQENLGIDSVSFLLEQGRENDCDSVLLVLNVDGFSVTVVDGHQLRGRWVPVVFLLCQGLSIESSFEWSRHGVTLQ